MPPDEARRLAQELLAAAACGRLEASEPAQRHVDGGMRDADASTFVDEVPTSILVPRNRPTRQASVPQVSERGLLAAMHRLLGRS